MKAIVFCAGNGTRLRPITNTIPKPMVKVGGKPVLEHIVEHLNRYGITDIIVNLHYKPEEIYKYFGTRLLYSFEPTLLGEHDTAKSLLPWLSDPFIAMNGDTLSEVNLDDMQTVFSETDCDRIVYAYDDDKKMRQGGIWIYWKEWFYKKKPVDEVYFSPSRWIDIGTPEQLKKAREIYERGG